MAKKKSSLLPKSLTTVTPFSKIMAVIFFFVFVLVGVYVGMKIQREVDYQLFNSRVINTTVSPTPSPMLYK